MTIQALRLFIDKQKSFLNVGNVVFTRKPTLIEVRLKEAGRSLDSPYSEALALFGKTDPRFERAWASHLRQIETCRQVLSVLDEPQVIEAEQIFTRSEEAIAGLSAASLVVVCGGDEYIKSAIRLCSPESHVLPINSDPQTSHGTCALSMNDLIRWQNEEIKLSAVPWRSIEARSKGRFLGRAVDTVFVGNPRQLTRTRFDGSIRSSSNSSSRVSDLRWDCNYALLNTGLGSTGWVLSAARDICPPAFGSTVADNEVVLDLYVSQPYQGRERSVLEVSSQRLARYGAIEIQSLMNGGGICAFGDGVIELNRGDRVRAHLSEGCPQIFVYTADLDLRLMRFITSDPEKLAESPDLYSSWLYVGNKSKLFMSRYIVGLYDEKGDTTILSIEEEQKSSGIFLAAPGCAPQWSRQTCYLDDFSVRKEFVFKPSAERFDLLVVGNNPSSDLSSEEHLVFDDPDQVLILNSNDPCTVAFDSYHEVEVEEGAIEFRIGRKGVPVFGLST